MNRRSFITKALAGLAAVPLLPKIAQALESASYTNPISTAYGRTILSDAPVFYWRLDEVPQYYGHPVLVWNRVLTQEEIEAHYDTAIKFVSSASS